MACPKCKAPLERHEISPGVFVSHCPSCFGVLYRACDISVPLKLVGASPARFDCPSCRRPMETAKAYDGQIEVDRCAGCGFLWFDAGEIQILRKLSGVENIVGKTDEESPAPPAAPAAAPKPAAAAPSLPPEPSAKERYDKAPVPPEMSGAKNPDMRNSPSVRHEGRTYVHFQTSVPVVTSVLGEFPWIARVGDAARMRDFVCPPYLVSQEVTASESTWSAGEYLEPEEVWSAFALPGAPPPKTGVAPAQPNPWAGEMWKVWLWFWAGAAISVGSYFCSSNPGSGGQVYEGGFSVEATDAERSRIGEVFTVGGRTSNLEITIDTNLDQRWGFFSMALIDADTDVALDFGQELSYYHGSEDGEGWSEGSKYQSFIVPSVPPGRYYLRVEPETDAPQVSFRVVIKRDVPLARLPAIALILLLTPALWFALRKDMFETERWTESDHPRMTGEDDDE